MIYLTVVTLLDSDQVGQEIVVGSWSFSGQLSNAEAIDKAEATLSKLYRMPEHWVWEVRLITLEA